MEELDTEPTLEELSKAIDILVSGKASGSDGIPPDLLKHCKTTLLHSLHVLLCQCWQEGAVPQDMWDAKIITLFKNKGERSDCNNYRGISLLSVTGKVFAKVILIGLQKLAERVYTESQCGFQAGRSTIDMVFSLCQLQEKSREQQMPLYIAFTDLTKAFDLVSRQSLPDPPKDWLPTKIAEHDRILPHKHERDSAVQWQLLQALWHPQWRQTRVCPSPNALWNLLCPALETRLWHSIRGNLSVDQIRWQAFQSWPPQSQDKGSWSPHQRHAVRRRCSSDNPHPAGAAGTDGPFLSSLQGFRTNHQSEEDKRPGAGYNGTASHHHQWLWARVSNTEVLSRANLPSMFTLLRQYRLRWLGHVYRMEDGRIPKDILYGELASGRRSKGCPQLRYKDVCKRDMKATDINTDSWEDLAADRMMWRSTLNQHLKTGENKLVNAERSTTTLTDQRPHTNVTFTAEIVSPT